MTEPSWIYSSERRQASGLREAVEREVRPQVAAVRDVTQKIEEQILLFVGSDAQPQAVLVWSRALSRQLDALQQTLKEGARLTAPAPKGLLAERTAPADEVEGLRAARAWQPSETDLQRGRAALLEEFKSPANLKVATFALLAGKSRQQVYKDLVSQPARLLSLSLGTRGQRIPDWQLDARAKALTQAVLERAPGIDSWTVYQALKSPSGALEGRSPVSAVMTHKADAERVTQIVTELLGLHQPQPQR